MKGGQSREVGSKESQREWVSERRDARTRDGWKGGFGGAEVFPDKVKVAERGGKGLGGVVEKKFNS